MTSLEDAEEGNSTRMGEEIPLIVTGVCRICLETDPIAELDEPCACKGSLQVKCKSSQKITSLIFLILSLSSPPSSARPSWLPTAMDQRAWQ